MMHAISSNAAASILPPRGAAAVTQALRQLYALSRSRQHDVVKQRSESQFRIRSSIFSYAFQPW